MVVEREKSQGAMIREELNPPKMDLASVQMHYVQPEEKRREGNKADEKCRKD